MIMASLMKNQSFRDRMMEGALAQTQGPAWLRAIQKKAFDRFRMLGFPHRKMEDWQHTNLERLLNQSFIPNDGHKFDLQDGHAFDKYNLVKEGERRVTFINHQVSPEYSLGRDLPSGVRMENWAEIFEKSNHDAASFYGFAIENETNPFAAINTFQMPYGIYLDVPAGKVMDLPMHFVFAGLGNRELPPALYPRILVRLGKNAKVNLVTSFISLNKEPYLMVVAKEIFLDEGAKLNWTTVSRQSEKANAIFSAKCHLKSNSSLERVSFSRGGDIIHHDLDIFLEGEAASCRADGLAVLADRSQVSEVLHAHHKASRCVSRQTYKNILDDQSMAEFNSLIHVYPGTKGSDSNQLNRNLILSREAKAFSRPQLKIDSDDVTASHGSATGQLEDRELFYLQSRGLNMATAKYILTYGFAEEILERIQPDSVRWQLELLVRKGIEAMSQRV